MLTLTRREGGCVSDARLSSEPGPVEPQWLDSRWLEPRARSPVAPAPPVVVLAGWEVSGRRASADAAGETGLTITDCTPLTKVQLRAPVGGQAAAAIGLRFGRAVRDAAGMLVVGSGPGEWLLLAAP